MSLPTLSGRGFLISDGIELKYSPNGTPYARLPLVFKRQKKNERTGHWDTQAEILIEGTVFGYLAESLNEVVSGHTEMFVSGEVYTEVYKDKQYIKMHVNSAWPVKEDRAAAAVGAGSDDDAERFPF